MKISIGALTKSTFSLVFLLLLFLGTQVTYAATCNNTTRVMSSINGLNDPCTATPCECAGDAKPICKPSTISTTQVEEIWNCSSAESGDSAGNVNLGTEVSPPEDYVFQTGIPGIVSKGKSIQSEGLTGLVGLIIKFVFGIAGLLALVNIIVGGVQHTVSAGNVNAQKDAKDRILQAVIGLVILFASYIILNTINPELTRLKEPSAPAAVKLSDGNTLGPDLPPPDTGPTPPPITDELHQKLWNCIETGSGTNAPNLSKTVTYGEGNWVCNIWAQAMYECAGISNYPTGGATEMYEQVINHKVGEPAFGDIAFWCNDYNYHAGPPESCDMPPDVPEYYNHIGIYIGNGQVAQCGDPCPSAIEPSVIPTHFMGYFRFDFNK